MEGNVFLVTVLNWEKWNPKRAQKSYSWLRLENDTLTSQDMHKVGMHGRVMWVHCLCQASRKNGAAFRIEVDYCADALEMTESQVRDALRRLADRGLVAIDAVSLHPHYPHTTPIRTTDGRTNERDERTDGDAHVATPGLTCGGLVELWQKHSGPLPKVQSTTLSQHRMEQVRARLNENADPAYWERVISTMARIPFFNGDSKSKWRATLGWLIEPGNHEKVAEGAYGEAGAGEIDWSKVFGGGK